MKLKNRRLRVIYLPHRKSLRTVNKQVQDAITYTFFMWSGILTAISQEVTQEGESL